MPFFQLSKDDLKFPPAYFADSEGLIAVGADISANRVLEAYKNGIYFWFGPMDPIKWWSPDPRIIWNGKTVTEDIGLPKSSHINCIRNTDIDSLLKKIQSSENKGAMGPNWLTEEMASTYRQLFRSEHCMVFDIFLDNILVGSILGISIGAAFFTEYIWIHPADDSKDTNDICLFVLSHYLLAEGFLLIDAQKENIRVTHASIIEISRLEYLDQLKKAVQCLPPLKSENT